MRLIVGLGNPGKEYENHRHNVGFMLIDAIADKNPNSNFVKKFHGLTKQVTIGGQRVLLLKPQTFMNKSGTSVAEAARFYKIAPKDIIVLHDELDLDPGKVRVKSGGSSGGHNGLKSIDSHLGNDYQRVRVGIGHPGTKQKVNGHVLSNFSSNDKGWLDPLLDSASSNIDRLLRGDNAAFLNKLALSTASASKKQMPEKVQQAAEKVATANPEPKTPKAAVNEPKKSNSIWQSLKNLFPSNA